MGSEMLGEIWMNPQSLWPLCPGSSPGDGQWLQNLLPEQELPLLCPSPAADEVFNLHTPKALLGGLWALLWD